MKFALAGSIACVALSLLTTPAKADYFINFTQMSSSHDWYYQGTQDLDRSGFTMSGRLQLADDAFDRGFNLSLGVNFPVENYINLKNVIGFELNFFAAGNLLHKWDLPYFLSSYSFGSTAPRYSIGMYGGAGTGVNGGLYLNNTESSVSMSFTGPDFYGTIGSDNPAFGCFSAPCEFSGHNYQKSPAPTPTPVPEPMSIALFGAGLAGLALVRRKA